MHTKEKTNGHVKNKLPGLVQWFGGKGNLCRTIAKYLPHGRVYCEPYGGAASMLFWIKPRPVEVYNDLDDRLINLCRVLQNAEKSEALISRLELTLYSRAEFAKALDIMHGKIGDDVNRAWAFFVVQNQGVSMDVCKTPGDWSRAFVESRGMARNVARWIRRVSLLPSIIERFKRVQVDNRDALEVIRYWDSPDTVFYLDPPYVASTRKSGEYVHECDDDHHEELVDLLLTIKGKAMISGYSNELYNRLDQRYERREIKTACHAAVCGRESGLQGTGSAMAKVPRTEVIWYTSESGGLFD